MDIFEQFLNAQLTIGDDHMLWREIVGNVFGLVSALGGMRRKVWGWPIGIVGNVLLFTVFLGSWFGMAGEHPDMLGQAGRQIMFIGVSIYGWYRWNQTRKSGGAGAVAVHPHWATWRQRAGLVLGMAAGTAGFALIFAQLNSWAPVPDAWIFVGSVLATYGMARGWVEFWLIWVAVDAVGVPLLFRAGYYATGFMYLFYGAFTIVGFIVWWRVHRRESGKVGPRSDAPADAVA
ncbi:nicotinamide mononucleotide transporter PnuC [Xylanimonas cellulosilytica DSM 15894]|uniref:Nicotinamide mononucleotide transporter PnuC n=1 Tax=Xylanimonas cellulosilytica (strain DSM 15894 / JCM 12276 / CECT 5975 / KCTC 9989 / LMG 20990 / NBRC 107835 / XIL07) TaxID=446471 RepID=D1BUM3_XYLCX|nr:nicotinamide riboside transporter PnuC [Xylanimonas cellulosilytica]ACZ29264.1 nicotinamide mononucleotide transporter PnuC [Xylanimonas cellulosilytica DSM 15894]